MRHLALVGLFAVAACEDTSYKDIGAEIGVLTKRDDALVPPAIGRLAAFGERALPQIETALHTASPRGRIHLLAAIDNIHGLERVPIVRHLAVYDAAPEVREKAHAMLSAWKRHPAAARALAWVEERRKLGEGPVTLGDRP